MGLPAEQSQDRPFYQEVKHRLWRCQAAFPAGVSQPTCQKTAVLKMVIYLELSALSADLSARTTELLTDING